MTKQIIKQLAHVCIFAQDLAQTEAFYCGVLGLEKSFLFERKGADYGFYLKLDARTFIEVFAKPESSYGADNSITHICLEVVNMDEAVAHIRAQGVEITDKSMAADFTWQAWLTDPNGVRIELFEYTDKSFQFQGGVVEATW